MPWDLTGNSGTAVASNFLGTTDNQPLAIRTNGSERIRITSDGNVGLGIANPEYQIAVSGTMFSGKALAPAAWPSPDEAWEEVPTLSHADAKHLLYRFSDVNWAGIGVHQGGDIWIRTGTGAQSVLQIDEGGGLSVSGLISSRKALAPAAWEATRSAPPLTPRDAKLLLYRFSDINWAGIGVHQGGDIWIRTGTGGQQVVVVTEAGSVTVPGDVQLTGGDCAEDFDVTDMETSEPGTAMVLDDSGVLRPSVSAYDRRVVGVVSGAGGYKPGVILDRRNANLARRPLALMGKVYCKADAGPVPIEVGDLLTTSEVPGHAMRATDAERSFGAILGKALGPLRHSQGLIPVLVTLQ